MKKIIEGMKFRIKAEIKNPAIDTVVGNIVEVIRTSAASTEFRDIKTFDWFVVDNEKIERCLEEIYE